MLFDINSCIFLCFFFRGIDRQDPVLTLNAEGKSERNVASSKPVENALADTSGNYNFINGSLHPKMSIHKLLMSEKSTFCQALATIGVNKAVFPDYAAQVSACIQKSFDMFQEGFTGDAQGKDFLCSILRLGNFSNKLQHGTEKASNFEAGTARNTHGTQMHIHQVTARMYCDLGRLTSTNFVRLFNNYEKFALANEPLAADFIKKYKRLIEDKDCWLHRQMMFDTLIDPNDWDRSLEKIDKTIKDDQKSFCKSSTQDAFLLYRTTKYPMTLPVITCQVKSRQVENVDTQDLLLDAAQALAYSPRSYAIMLSSEIQKNTQRKMIKIQYYKLEFEIGKKYVDNKIHVSTYSHMCAFGQGNHTVEDFVNFLKSSTRVITAMVDDCYENDEIINKTAEFLYDSQPAWQTKDKRETGTAPSVMLSHRFDIDRLCIWLKEKYAYIGAPKASAMVKPNRPITSEFIHFSKCE